MTNAPREGLGASAGWEQRRVRWQVELASRVFKGEGGIERAQARNRWRVPREPYARRLAMAVPRWVLLAAGHRQRRHSGQPAPRRRPAEASLFARRQPSTILACETTAPSFSVNARPGLRATCPTVRPRGAIPVLKPDYGSALGTSLLDRELVPARLA